MAPAIASSLSCKRCTNLALCFLQALCNLWCFSCIACHIRAIAARIPHAGPQCGVQVSLVACTGCGRTFKPEALEHHAPSCKGSSLPPPAALQAPLSARAGLSASAKAPAGKAAGKASSAGPGGRPSQLVCYLCGSQFGSSSLRIHIPQCKAKWDAQVRHVRAL